MVPDGHMSTKVIRVGIVVLFDLSCLYSGGFLWTFPVFITGKGVYTAVVTFLCSEFFLMLLYCVVFYDYFEVIICLLYL